MTPEYLNDLARRVIDFMEDAKAVRSMDGKVERYLSVMELAQALDFRIQHWPLIKEIILSWRTNLCFTPGRGHFLGVAGEEVYNVIFVDCMARGWSNRARRYVESLGADNNNNYDNDARESYCQNRLGISWEELRGRYATE